MKILITPSDIIERALWQKYQYYILEDVPQVDIDKMVTENKEFEMPERDAIVIKLVSVIETNNLISRLNSYVLDLIATKNSTIKQTVIKHKTKGEATTSHNCIRKNTITEELAKFLKNFPDTWNPSLAFSHGYKELKEYIDALVVKLETLSVIVSEFHGHKVDYVQVTHVKKMLNFNH